MPTRADMEAATPKCDRAYALYAVGPCGKPLRWTQISGEGRWICAAHGNVLSGPEAAERAGYVPVGLAA